MTDDRRAAGLATAACWGGGLADAVDLLYRRDGGRQPQILFSDTGSYTDMVLGLLKLLGVAYRPELADLPDQKLWRISPSADYGMLDASARGGIDLGRVRQHWPDILRMVASVHSGAVSACDVMRMLHIEPRLNGGESEAGELNRRSRVSARTSLRQRLAQGSGTT